MERLKGSMVVLRSSWIESAKIKGGRMWEYIDDWR
jgi:hypothetical protein